MCHSVKWKKDVPTASLGSGVSGGLVTKLCPTLATPWTVAHQASLSMGLPRQEHWSGLPCPPPGELPHPGMELVSPASADRFFTTEPPGKPAPVK